MPVPPPDPQGGGGGGGGSPTGAAGGDLAGTYPNPTVGLLKITDAKVAAANKDGLANVPSLRTLGTGAQQAMPGDTVISGGISLHDANVGLSAGGGEPLTALAPQLMGTAWNDGTEDRVIIDPAGGGLSFKDSGGNASSSLSETGLHVFTAGVEAFSVIDEDGRPEVELVDPTDATQLFYSARGSGTFYAYNIAQTTNASLQLGATEEATPTAALQTNGAASALITLDDGGIQIGFNDLIAESYVAALAAAVNNGAGLGGFQLRQAAAFSMLDGSQIARIVAKPDSSGVVVNNSGGVAQQQIGDAAVGFFAATPVAQQPAGSTAADAIACLQAFGLMAA